MAIYSVGVAVGNFADTCVYDLSTFPTSTERWGFYAAADVSVAQQ
jgi:hypothetical protein